MLAKVKDADGQDWYIYRSSHTYLTNDLYSKNLLSVMHFLKDESLSFLKIYSFLWLPSGD